MRDTFRLSGSATIMLVLLALGGWGSGVCSQALADDPKPSFLPKATLRTTGDKNVQLRDLAGDKIAVFNLMYTRCTGEFCGRGMENLVKVQNQLGSDGRLGKEVVIFSITLDPERDTPGVLKKYADRYGVKPGWTFLTGDAQAIDKLRLKLEPLPLDDFKKEQEAPKLRHSGMLFIINGATGSRTSISVTAKPDRIVDLIGRVASPKR